MTILAITLGAILWVVYGVFVAKQAVDSNNFIGDEVEEYVMDIVGAPIIFVSRAIVGIFRQIY